MLPATKEQPKEMLPFFARRSDGKLCVKPMLQLVFEALYEAEIRDFCFIVGRGKRSIEDHFAIDDAFLNYLRTKRQLSALSELECFYEKIRHSHIVFVNQPEARGFGDAVYQAKPLTGGMPFIVHAGDDLIVSKNNAHLSALINTFEAYNADVALYVERVKDPTKYGVVVGEQIQKKLIKVRDILEKPASPPSDIATVAVYIFNAKIFEAIEKTEPDRNNEIQLTNAIRQLIKEGKKVYAMELDRDQRRVDIGTPMSYWMALKYVLSQE